MRPTHCTALKHALLTVTAFAALSLAAPAPNPPPRCYSPRTVPVFTSDWYGWNSQPGRTGTYTTSGRV